MRCGGDVAFWHIASISECPLGRRLLRAKRTSLKQVNDAIDLNVVSSIDPLACELLRFALFPRSLEFVQAIPLCPPASALLRSDRTAADIVRYFLRERIDCYIQA
jgi:hypothetical protein